MQLFLVRHAEAEESPAGGRDAERRLTAKGRRQAARAADLLGGLGLGLAAVWHSPLARAVETAEVVARAVRSRRGPVERGGLGPLDPVGPVADELAGLDTDLIIVGHEPFLGRLAARLLTGSESARVVSCGRAGPVCLERGATGAWVVRWALRQEVLELRSRRRPRAQAAGRSRGARPPRVGAGSKHRESAGRKRPPG